MSSITLILSDAGVSGRSAAILLLATEKNLQVLPALREALKDKDTSVRAAAVHSIALHDDPAYGGSVGSDERSQGARPLASGRRLHSFVRNESETRSEEVGSNRRTRPL